MRQTHQVTGIIYREGAGYVAFSPEVEIASQGETVEDARCNLAEALELFFEVAEPSEVRERLRDEVYITHLHIAIH